MPSDEARPGWLRLPWDWLAMAGGLLYWLFFGGLLTLLGGPLYWILPRGVGERIGQWLLHGLFRMFVIYLRLAGLVRVDSSALRKLAAHPGPAIIAPNHVSLWDAVFIIARLPRVTCVMKQSILKNPLLGGGARLAGFIPNRSDKQVIRDGIAAMGRGNMLLLFPEGTRTRRDAEWINPLGGGCAIIASRSGAPVIPVFIRTSGRYLEKGWPLWKRPVFPVHIDIDLGSPMIAGAGETSRDFTARMQRTFEEELAKPHPLRRQPVADLAARECGG